MERMCSVRMEGHHVSGRVLRGVRGMLRGWNCEVIKPSFEGEHFQPSLWYYLSISFLSFLSLYFIQASILNKVSEVLNSAGNCHLTLF